MDDGLEEAARVLIGRGRRRRAELGEQSRELRAPRRIERGECIERRAERFGPRTERQDLLAHAAVAGLSRPAPYNRRVTFVVRVSADGPAGITGIVERVTTGEKHRFHGLEALAPLLAALIAVEAGATPAGPEEVSS